MMAWFIASLAVLVLGIAAVVGAGGLGQIGPMKTDRLTMDLPQRRLSAQDLRELQFTVVPRGYAMDQVDEVISRLQDQLDHDLTDSQELSQ
ncbi:MAG: DivIVA domain-containing protein [Propionibacteriaceae bacterium]|jgi:DivIVA domain-containing protein|nr:DivIVA domain-containing protein [Propionibacteriaceae bacterium]